MARKPTTATETVANDDDKMISDSQGKNLPETTEAGERAPAVRDLPPANPLGEPVHSVETYPNISEAGKQASALGIKTEESTGDHPFGETIVEHPVSPTDAVPNPHGQRSNPDADQVITTNDKGVAERGPRDETGDVEVTGADDLRADVHLGDGRTLGKGQTMKVSKDVAKILRDNKQVK